jgi:RimJ/RimL family protein N-acetyltransferase
VTGDHWLVMYTGVGPAHRRRGLARAAKTRLHTEVATRGARSIETTNEASNTAIRALNEALGYRPTEGEYRLRYDRP